MKILTWNINGIRSRKEPMKQIFEELDADVICFQETKVTRDQLDELSAIVEGFNSYFSFSKVRSGYSGVATFVRDKYTPINAEDNLSGLNSDRENSIGHYGDHSDFSDEELTSLDNEGRTVITQHRIRDDSGKESLLAIINVYCPRADPENDDRKLFKLRFYDLLELRAKTLLESGNHVIILGDVNTSHNPIDHCDPDEKEFHKNPGRHWLNGFLNQNFDELQKGVRSQDGRCFVDTFRFLHPERQKAFTCWSTTTGARSTNYGTRIDYIFADSGLLSDLSQCEIFPEIEGSDHCPVKADFNVNVVSGIKPPPLCSKYLPEFAGRQQKLSSYFSAKTGKDIDDQLEIPNVASDKESESQRDKCSLKRNHSGPGRVSLKKTKSENSKSSIGKQGSLLSFFKKTSNTETDKQSSDSQIKNNGHISAVSSCNQGVCGDRGTQGGIAAEDRFCGNLTKKNSYAANSWKSLLKGPPPAPLCKGHKEACVFRTVKKDGLNKGRQFWVCNRPEGHKSNPEARCEHFEWIVKGQNK